MEIVERNCMKKTGELIFDTVAAWLVVMFFYFLQGASVTLLGLSGSTSRMVQAALIGASVIIALLFFGIRNTNLSCLGFVKPDGKAFKGLLYLIPMILVALSGCVFGMDLSDKWAILSFLILTICVGFSEEIYFRGIILKLWLDNRGKAAAIIISSVMFGVTHILNVMSGAGFVETILQICFAFFYGVIFAFIMIRTGSIWPGIILHFLHDFCSFTGRTPSPEANIILAAVQTVVMLVYMMYLIFTKKIPSANPDDKHRPIVE